MGPLWKHFGLTSQPKEGHKHEIHTFMRLPKARATSQQGSGQRRTSPLGCSFAHLWCIFGSLWIDKGRFNITLTVRGSSLQNTYFCPTFFQIPRGAWGRQPGFRGSEPDRLGGGRARVNRPPRRLVWRVWCWFKASTRLEARGLGGFESGACDLPPKGSTK